jgi:hypothetical protein
LTFTDSKASFSRGIHLLRYLAGAVAVILIGLVIGLTPLTFADPPDPTWVGGYWDDDDFDNVVVFISGASAVVASIAADHGPLWVQVARVEPLPLGPGPITPGLLLQSRAPPLRISSSA